VSQVAKTKFWPGVEILVFFLRGLPNANFPAGGDGNTITFVLSRGWWNPFVRPGRMATLPSCSKAPKILVPKVRLLGSGRGWWKSTLEPLEMR